MHEQVARAAVREQAGCASCAHARTARSTVLRDRLEGSCYPARNAGADDGPEGVVAEEEEEEREEGKRKLWEFFGKLKVRDLLIW